MNPLAVLRALHALNAESPSDLLRAVMRVVADGHVAITTVNAEFADELDLWRLRDGVVLGKAPTPRERAETILAVEQVETPHPALADALVILRGRHGR